MQKRCEFMFPAALVFSILLMTLGLMPDAPGSIPPGLYRVVSMQDLLITDYVQIAGVGAALVNSGPVTPVSILLIRFSGEAFNGFTRVELGSLASFALFGKNVFNIRPILLGVYLRAYGMHLSPDYPTLQLAGLFGATLAPISGHFGWPFGILAAVLRRRKPSLRNADYYDLFEETAPIAPSVWLNRTSDVPDAPMSGDADLDSFDVHTHTRE